MCVGPFPVISCLSSCGTFWELSTRAEKASAHDESARVQMSYLGRLGKVKGPLHIQATKLCEKVDNEGDMHGGGMYM